MKQCASDEYELFLNIVFGVFDQFEQAFTTANYPLARVVCGIAVNKLAHKRIILRCDLVEEGIGFSGCCDKHSRGLDV